MSKKFLSHAVGRRTVLKAGVAIGAMQVASPFVVKALGESRSRSASTTPSPALTPSSARTSRSVASSRSRRSTRRVASSAARSSCCRRISTSANTGTAVQKAHKLIDRDKVNFMLGNVNSSMALAIGEVTSKAGVLHIVTGGHTDAVTGKDCHWNVFRVCNTTRMETNSVSKVLFDKFGKKWYFITPDYSFGHTLQQGFEASLKKFGGTEVGASLTPLGTSDYSSYLIKAQAANPDVIIFLTAGQDAVNSLKQAVQFGLNKKFHIAGAQQELEVLEGLPPNARIGTWVFEWYWNQPNVPHVKEFVAAIQKRTGGKVPTARHWFGYASTWTSR